MINENETKELYNIVKKLSQLETNEIELMISIFKKLINEEIEKKVYFLNNEFENACNNYRKKVENMQDIKDEIIGSYQKQFYKIKERIEEQYVNLIIELQEAQSCQKMVIVDYEKIVNSDFLSSEDNEKAEALIDKYGNYCGLEEECYRMLEECSISLPYLLDTVMKYEEKNLQVQEAPKGIISKIKIYFKNLLASNNFEKNYLDDKRKKIIQIQDNTNEVIEGIRNNTINYIDTLDLYKEQIKEAANTNIIA